MAWFTAGDIDATIGTATRLALVGSATTAGSAFARFEEWARADVQSAGHVAGYTISDVETNATVQRLAIAAFYSMAAGARKGQPVPERIKEDLYRLEQLRSGEYPIPGLTPSERDGIGGVKFSSTTGADARGQRFSRKKITGYW